MNPPEELAGTNARRTAHSRRWTAPKLVVLLAPLVIFLVMGWAQRWTSDDGFINVRIAQMLLDGHGFVYNVGERVEAGTSTIWIAIITALGALGLRLEIGAMLAGLFLSTLGVGCATAGAWWLRTGGKERAWSTTTFFPLGMLIYVAVPVTWDYATSGLETGLSLAWIGATILGLSIWADAADKALHLRAVRSWRLTMLGASLGPLIRPELAVFSFVVAGVLILGNRQTFGMGRRLKSIAWAALLLGTIPVCYQIWRMGYFASLVPNTALAKEAFRPRWAQGLHFFHNFFDLYHLLIPLALASAALAADFRARLDRPHALRALVLVSPWITGVFYVLYVLRVGGGFMHGRMWLPPLFFLLAPVACVQVKTLRSWRFLVVCVACAWALFVATQIRVARDNQHGIGDERGWYSRQAKVSNPVLVEDYKRHFFMRAPLKTREQLEQACQGDLGSRNCSTPPKVLVTARDSKLVGYRGWVAARRDAVAPGTALIVAHGAIGIRGVFYGPGVHVVDIYGLADPIASRMVLLRAGRPGHEKRMPMAWVYARFAEPRESDSRVVKSARATLACTPAAELLDAVTEPMTMSRFWRNIWLAPKLHRLRVHPNPSRAAQTLCRENF